MTVEETEVTARFEERRWVFPREDCLLLPVQNTTAEELARWIAAQLAGSLEVTARERMTCLRIEVEENFGQWAICEFPVAELCEPAASPERTRSHSD